MGARPPGRPRRDQNVITRDDILQLALRTVREEGAAALSVRGLAARLRVTPMTVSYHTGGRRDLMAAVVNLAFAGLDAPAEGKNPATRLRQLMRDYCRRALENHGLMLAVLADPALMEGPLEAFTTRLRDEIAQMADPAETTAVLNLLVDYTHGFVVAAAAAPAGDAPGVAEFLSSLDWVLDRLTAPV